MSEKDRSRWVLVLPTIAMAGVFVFGTEGLAQERVAQSPTYAGDVAAVLEVCTQCHQEGGIGPMPLTTFQEVSRYSALLKDMLESRQMPPWGVDHTVGIQEFKNDISLSDKEISTVVAWIDAGAPAGNLDELPPPLPPQDWNDWQLQAELGPPDFVIKSQPVIVPAEGQDRYPDHSVYWEGLPEDRYFRAAELKNTERGRATLHHGHAILQQEGRQARRFTAMGAGKRYDRFADDTGVRIPAGRGEVEWFLHYYPMGEEVVDTVEVAVWLYPEGETPRFATEGEQRFVVGAPPFSNDILVPPHGKQTLTSEFILDKPMLIHSFRPHMHLHGITASMSVIYPQDRGDWRINVIPRKEVLTRLDNYNHLWQLNYVYEDDARPLLPKGTVLLLEAEFDNTADNPLSVDPDQWVTWGQRSVDAMAHMFVYANYLTDEEYEELRDERERKPRLASDDGGDNQ